MDEKALKTSWKQRIIILVIAVLLLGSTIFAYMFIVLSGSGSKGSASTSSIEKLTKEYDQKTAEIQEAAKPLSEKYFKDFESYLAKVKAYNTASANASGLHIEDLKRGDGKELKEGDYDYMAYYLGWCADGTVFQSSFDSSENPTSLNAPLIGTQDMIEGWSQGIIGMKLGGVRELTIPGELAYGETKEICGGKNSPLKFIVMALEKDENLAKLDEELAGISLELYYAYYAGAGQ